MRCFEPVRQACMRVVSLNAPMRDLLKGFSFNPGHAKTMCYGIIFFVYGALTHLVMLRVYLYHSYQRTAWPQWADQFLPYVIMGTSGGVCLAYFLLRLRTKVAESGRTHPILALGRSGLYGMAATVLAVACSVVVASLWLGPRLSPTKSQIPYHVMLVTTESGTYALGAALSMMPFAFGWGLLGGICILLLSGAEIPPQRLPTVQPSDSGRLPLTLGILGIIL